MSKRPTRAKTRACALVSALFLFSASVSCSQHPHSSSIFGIQLNADNRKLLDEIETAFGPIREIVQNGFSESGALGESHFADDGTPVITIDAKDGRNEGVIAHELYHFRLTRDGFTWFRVTSAEDAARQLVTKHSESIRENVVDPVQHVRLFPTYIQEQTADQAINGSRFRELSLSGESIKDAAKLDPVDRTAALFHLLLELKDKSLVQREVEGFRSAGWEDEADTAEGMAKLAREAELKTADQMDKLMAGLLGALFSAQLVARPGGMGSGCIGRTCCPVLLIVVSSK